MNIEEAREFLMRFATPCDEGVTGVDFESDAKLIMDLVNDAVEAEREAAEDNSFIARHQKLTYKGK